MTSYDGNPHAGLQALIARAPRVWKRSACGVTRSETAISALVHTDACAITQTPVAYRRSGARNPPRPMSADPIAPWPERTRTRAAEATMVVPWPARTRPRQSVGCSGPFE